MIKYLIIFFIVSLVLFSCSKLEPAEKTKKSSSKRMNTRDYLFKILIPSFLVTLSIYFWDNLSSVLPSWMGGVSEEEKLFTGDYFDIENAH